MIQVLFYPGEFMTSYLISKIDGKYFNFYGLGFRQSNINFYVADAAVPVVTTVKSLDDIGPEFNFTAKVRLKEKNESIYSKLWSFNSCLLLFVLLGQFCFKVSTANFPVSLLYLTLAMPTATKDGNQLLYVTKVETQEVFTDNFYSFM